MKKKKRNIYSLFITISVVLSAVIILFFIALGNQQEPQLREYGSSFAVNEIPEEFIPVYQDAAEEYNVSWELLAAIHRVETVFSTMNELESPVGALGHMQFMPCTFVGWNYPGCEGNGSLDIPESELTSVEVIEEYGGYGTDGNGNGRADPYNLEDAVYSTANYLASNGAGSGREEAAIFNYNQADWYVDEVLEYRRAYSEEYVAVELSDEEKKHIN
ncbi:transglycosylase-like protein with SLT domain [Sinobaca qinghaiensis]|uniref:Transglycosylase-like protein with SLT domain n=1 Tax=Sinobaca qinghaiensis TaxID=342944 RepID=A0A419V3S2_9BACL|nr:transglycosylase SLT domain-containing protein [Sinobaca qinghaiensis]RKD73144.1 transglycosylase-like protein with SLT domain [Sinobaca qinghaiensis]